MSALIVDEALLREPRLWTPGKKPLGPVKVDPAYNYNCACFWLFGGHGTNLPHPMTRDLMNPQATITLSDSSIIFTPEYIYPIFQNAQCQWLAGLLTPPYSILTGFTYIDWVVSWSLFASNWTGVYGLEDGHVIVTNEDDFSGNITTSPGPRIPGSAVDFLAITVRDNNNAAACTNGGAVTLDTSVTAPTYTPGKLVLGGDFEGGNSGHAKIAFFAVFRCAFSDAELQALTRDPYQLLIPA